MTPVLAIVIACSLAIPAVAMVAIVKQAANGSLQRNGSAGIRMAPLTDSDQAWQVGHAAALPATKLTMIATLVCTVVAIVAYFAISENAYTVAVMVSPMVFIAGMALTVVKARAAAAEVSEG